MVTTHSHAHTHSDGVDVRHDVKIRRLAISDLKDCLRLGFSDFDSKPSHLFLLGMIYPVATLIAAVWALNNDLVPLLFPLISGYALLGPVAAIVLYEVSRRRERGEDFSWQDGIGLFTGHAGVTIAALALTLLAIFTVWLWTAQAIYEATLGGASFSSFQEFGALIFGTSDGMSLLIIGNAVGFMFASSVLACFLVSFPMVLDRDVSATDAMMTSVRVTLANPIVVGVWGFIIAASLLIGASFLLAGLAIVLPVLGHASWHFYRKAVRWP